jgi:hypothetical protein
MLIQSPDGDPAAIFDRALDLLVKAVQKKKLAATKSPRPSRARDREHATFPRR